MCPVRYPSAMRRLVNEFSKLPSIGEKSAVRLAYHILSTDERDVNLLASSISECRNAIQFCSICYFLAESSKCEICSDSLRDVSKVCVVEKPADVIAIERSGGYEGVYHVLHGLWSPLRGVGPSNTKVKELLERATHQSESNSPISEVVVATGTTVEGDATALYIATALSELGIETFRIAQGLPKGGELEFADDVTLTHAIQGRRRL